MTRVCVSVTSPTADSYQFGVSCPDKDWQAKPRTLVRRPNHYPVPGAGESALWMGGVHADLCAEANDDLRVTLHSHILVDPEGEEIFRFGKYLFAIMFGAAWKELRDKMPADPFEIEIHTAPEAEFLDSLPWELMWNDEAPLIGQNNTIARVIERKAVTPATLEVPPRVLFVVGELDDDLRPGAEYIEILHSLGRKDSNGTRIPGAALPVRSLVDADAAQISDAVDKFSPHIVHFVAHGMSDDKNRAVIRLTRRERGKANVPDLCTAERLIELLTPAGKPPPAIVIVNACHTAAEPGLGGARALAAELVRRGIPAAIGMAGEVASSACRLFARAFYRSLAEQEPILAQPSAPCPIQKAVGDGQRAARRYSTNANDNVEWARPSLFLAAGSTFPLRGDAARDALIGALANLVGSSRPMHGRTVAMREYEEFIGFRGDGAKRVLAYAQSFRRENLKEVNALPYKFKLGKTTLLSQLQARALLDGYVPCLIESFLEGPMQPPANLLRLSMRLAEVMDGIRKCFKIEPVVTSFAQQLVFEFTGRGEIKYEGAGSVKFERAMGEVKKALVGSGIGLDTVDPASIGRAIRADVEKLLEDVRQKCPPIKGALILLDDLHRYKDYYHHIFELLDQHGLGTAKAPAPLIITYEDFTEEGKRIADTLSKLHGVGGFAQTAQIDPFPDDPEGRLAYSQYLLLQQHVCARRGRSMQQLYEKMLRVMHRKVLGVPTFLMHADSMIEFAREQDPSPLADADDEAVFAALQKEP